MSTEDRIVAAQVTTVALPSRGAIRHSDGDLPAWQSRHLVELHTASGQVGLGEASPRASVEQVTAAAESLIGEDPFNLEKLRVIVRSEKFYRMDLASVSAALETACLDIQGKALDRPVADVLGGRMRERIPVIGYLFRKTGVDQQPSVITDDDLIEEAHRLVDTYGCRTLKYKAGSLTPEEDVEATRRLREAFPDHRLRVDPNGSWSVATALRIARKLEPYDLEWLEDPTLGIRGMGEFSRRSTLPVATNMCCIQPRDLASTVAARAVDVVLLDPWYVGGPWSAHQMAYACRTFDIGVGIHAGGGSTETGLGLAAQAHLAASLPGFVHAMDTMNPELLDDVITERWSYEGGDLVLPDAPGLGVSLDAAKVAEYAEKAVELAMTSRTANAANSSFPSYPRH